MTGCDFEVVGLALLSVALMISLCLNVILCIRPRATLCVDTYECCFVQVNDGESQSQNEGYYFHGPDRHEGQENAHNHHEQQENPIYGNISTERGSLEDCYEMMTMQHKRNHTKHLETDLNYASLDLKLANKHKKKKNRQQQGNARGRNKLPDQPPAQLTPPGSSTFLEVEEADIDAHLPPRDTSTMVSHSSIYLNSQQIAQETEEMERERAISMDRENAGWEGIIREDNEPSTVWIGAQESEGRKDRHDYSNNGSVCTQLLEVVAATQSDTDHLFRSFSHDSVEQD